ncbi:cytochrome P450 2K1-like [Polyodon spathula]|uniref:cytochrome P450 2K1-like n=1 Tax=Polyodon spathula TaxID=7913 RepID=UPI001B7E1A53|nr:cytochrome P450 2K1-like [Polyodon spathula]
MRSHRCGSLRRNWCTCFQRGSLRYVDWRQNGDQGSSSLRDGHRRLLLKPEGVFTTDPWLCEEETSINPPASTKAKASDKVQEEIERVIGRERPPQAEDRKSMPYMDAVLHEIQRVGNVVPMNLLHETTGDTTFRGYRIPKGTPVIPLLSSVLSDKTQWETPHQFNPNHFLDAQGKFVKRDAFMPFSAGQVCLGETLAKVELFLFFTMLLQKFHFRPPQEVSPEQLDLTPTPGITSGPQPFQLCALSH